MPLPMVHLAVAKNICNSGFPISELRSFYLGSISPDAIHMRENADRMAKNQTHLNPSGIIWNGVDEIEYCRFIHNFIESNQHKANMDFLWGYCVHILTDMFWFKWIYTDFIERYKKDLSPIQDERWAYYNDTICLFTCFIKTGIDKIW